MTNERCPRLQIMIFAEGIKREGHFAFFATRCLAIVSDKNFIMGHLTLAITFHPPRNVRVYCLCPQSHRHQVSRVMKMETAADEDDDDASM